MIPVSAAEGALHATVGFSKGFLTGAGISYGLGAISVACPPCAIGIGGGLLIYGAYKLYDGGARAIWEAGNRIYEGTGTAADFELIGNVGGGLASLKVAPASFLEGRAAALEAPTAIRTSLADAVLSRVVAEESAVGRDITNLPRTGSATKTDGQHGFPDLID